MKNRINDNLWDVLIIAILIMTVAAMCSCNRPQPIKYWQTSTSLNATPINLPEPALTEEQLERLHNVTITHDRRGEIWHVKRQK